MMKGVGKTFVWLSILIPSLLLGTEYRPWFGRNLEFELRTSYAYQYYPRMDAGGKTFQQDSNNHFRHSSLSISPLAEWSFEVEGRFFDTPQHTFTREYAALTARYLLMNDSVGDMFSVAVGVTYRGVSLPARRNFSVIYHGDTEWEGHVAVGKESSCYQFWQQRSWGVFGIGIANRGHPWFRANLSWEANCWDLYNYGAFLHSLWGLGNNTLSLVPPFHGYRDIRHQTMDVGVRAEKHFDIFGSLSAAYAYRVHAKNAPTMAHTLIFQILYPFGF